MKAGRNFIPQSSELGAELRRLRKGFRFTLKRVVREIGGTEAALSQVEKGKRGIAWVKLQKLAKLYDVPEGPLLLKAGILSMDWVSTFFPPPETEQPDPFKTLGREERDELLRYLSFVRWRQTLPR